MDAAQPDHPPATGLLGPRSIDDIHNEIFLRVQECLKEN